MMAGEMTAAGLLWSFPSTPLVQARRIKNLVQAGGGNRKLCSLSLSIMNRMGVKLDHFGDARTCKRGCNQSRLWIQ